MAQTPEANIIKLPNISASVPQLKDAIRELQEHGYRIPDYLEESKDDAERELKRRYDAVKGSAVNPVLEGLRSTRTRGGQGLRLGDPHRMGADAGLPSHVASMDDGDFFGNEQSTTIGSPTTVRIEHVAADGTVTVLKDGLELQAGEILDSTFMSCRKLAAFLDEQMKEAARDGILFSPHMKATMMKVSTRSSSHAARAYFAVFEKHAATFERIGVDTSNGFGDVLARIAELPDEERAAIEADIEEAYRRGPDLAMVDSDRGITNLHVPNDVIIDASMPAMLGPRDGCGTRTGRPRTPRR